MLLFATSLVSILFVFLPALQSHLDSLEAMTPYFQNHHILGTWMNDRKSWSMLVKSNSLGQMTLFLFISTGGQLEGESPIWMHRPSGGPLVNLTFVDMERFCERN